MADANSRLSFEYLENFMADALTAAGVPKEDAKVCAEVLIGISTLI